jgi:hypothetical protein
MLDGLIARAVSWLVPLALLINELHVRGLACTLVGH